MLIEPVHWHPILVHFSFALLFLAPFFMLAGVKGAEKEWAHTSLKTGRVMLFTGVIISVFTVGAGFVAMWNVNVSEEVHHHIHNHRNWALGTAALFTLLALWSLVSWKRHIREGWFFILLTFVGAGALAMTGYKGGELVYHHGVSINKSVLQESSAYSESGGHSGHNH